MDGGDDFLRRFELSRTHLLIILPRKRDATTLTKDHLMVIEHYPGCKGKKKKKKGK
jgi:hypothetical protein